jgi:Protein of unknown function (DUF4239)
VTSAIWALVAFLCMAGGILFGAWVRGRLPEPHLSADSKEVVRLGAGLIGTMAAVVLGLLIASAKSSYDTQDGYVKRITADLILIDRLLEQYGAEAAPLRTALRRGTAVMIDNLWRKPAGAAVRSFQTGPEAEQFYRGLEELAPRGDLERALKGRASQAAADLAQTRLLLFANADTSIPAPFLIVLILWLIIIFTSFSLFAEPNGFVVAALCVFALSAASALFLVIEMSQPFTGLMQIPSEPLRRAFAAVGA